MNEIIGLVWTNLILNPMVNSLLLIYQFLFHNFGLAIIVFTAVIRLITMPLTVRQQRSMEKMQEMQRSKRWQELEKKHKGDRARLQQEQMKLYRETGVNPFGGCLPLLLQLPIIIGLYQSITRALPTVPQQLLELSKHIYSFVPASLIPLNSQFLWWNLSQPERVVGPEVLGYTIPVLTILVVLTSFMQTRMTTPPSADSQGAQMSKMMSLYMPILFGLLAYSYAAGLALYFVTTNVMTIAQYGASGKFNWRSLLSLRGTS
jgi:YidC/Oxa1 family membrane protein insertase